MTLATIKYTCYFCYPGDCKPYGHYFVAKHVVAGCFYSIAPVQLLSCDWGKVAARHVCTYVYVMHGAFVQRPPLTGQARAQPPNCPLQLVPVPLDPVPQVITNALTQLESVLESKLNSTSRVRL